MKTEAQKKKLIDQLRKTPIIQIACERSGISRATYYRWRKADEKFYEESENALSKGIDLVNDMAESQLISGIRDKNLTAIIFWLKNHHKNYKTRVELSGSIKTTGETLTPEQEQAICQALTMANLNTNPINHDKSKSTKQCSDPSNNKGSKGKKRSDKK